MFPFEWATLTLTTNIVIGYGIWCYGALLPVVTMNNVSVLAYSFDLNAHNAIVSYADADADVCTIACWWTVITHTQHTQHTCTSESSLQHFLLFYSSRAFLLRCRLSVWYEYFELNGDGDTNKIQK